MGSPAVGTPIATHFYKLPFYHWLPRPLRAKLLMRLPLAHAGKISTLEKAHQIVEGARLIDGAQMKILFPESDLSFERFYGLPKSMIAVLAPKSSEERRVGQECVSTGRYVWCDNH